MKLFLRLVLALVALQATAFADCCYNDRDCFIGFHCYAVDFCGQVGLGKCLWHRDSHGDYDLTGSSRKANPALEDGSTMVLKTMLSGGVPACAEDTPCVPRARAKAVGLK